jgi:hypothetical protein
MWLHKLFIKESTASRSDLYIYHYGYCYQVLITPLKVLFFYIIIIIIIPHRSLFAHYEVQTTRQSSNEGVTYIINYLFFR